MVNYDVPTAATKFSHKSGLLRVVGADTHTHIGVRSWVARWGNAVQEEVTLDSDIPKFTTGPFHGEFEAEFVTSTDSNFDWHSSATPGSDGEVPELQLNVKETDTQGTPATKTWTIYFKVSQVERQWRGEEGYLHTKVRGMITRRPTVA